MGMLGDFAEGFFKTSADTVLDRKKRQDEIDDARKKAIALVDPAADLAKRNSDIELEQYKAKQKYQNDSFAEMLDRINHGTGADPGINPNAEATPSASPVGFMTPTAGSSSPNTPAPSPMDGLTKIHNELQEALKMKAVAAASGNKQQEQYWDTVVDMKKSQYTYASDTIKTGSAPVNSSEGTNIVAQIQKEHEDKLKNPVKYQSDYLPPKINGLLNQAEIAQIEDQSVIKHAALAQVVADVKKRANPAVSTEEVYPIIREQTKKIVTNINIINSTDSRISEEEKKKAVKDIDIAIKDIVKDNPSALQEIWSDPNFKAIFDDATIANIDKYKPQASTQPAATQPETKTTSKYKEGQTATNPKTGEKMVYRNGAWTKQ